MPMEVIFTDEDLEPVPEKPAKSGASSLNAPKAAVKADEPREESLFGDLEDALGLEPVFAPAPGPFGAPPAKLPDWIKTSAELPPELLKNVPAFESDPFSKEGEQEAEKPPRRKKASGKAVGRHPRLLPGAIRCPSCLRAGRVPVWSAWRCVVA